MLERLSNEYAGRLNFYEADIESNMKAAVRHGVTRIPAVKIFKEGKEIANRVGAGSYDAYKTWLDSSLE